MFVRFLVASGSEHGSITTIFVFNERMKRSDQRKEEEEEERGKRFSEECLEKDREGLRDSWDLKPLFERVSEKRC